MSQHLTTQLKLSTLCLSPLNARPSSDHGEMDGLKASILAHGILQPLQVIPAGNSSTGLNEVTIGGRRLKALMQLAAEGTIDGDHDVPCTIVSAEDADIQSMSIAENVVRRAMSPVVEFEAFARLHESGKSETDIAREFGCTVRHVKQRLALGKTAPAVRDALRDGDIDLDTAKAFTLGDVAAQEAILAGTPARQLSSYLVRRQLTSELDTGASYLVRLVGRDAYVEAGGAIREDLFDETQTIFEDRALLTRLADAKLQERAEALKADGWAWVLTTIEEGLPEHVYDMTYVRPTFVQRTEEEVARREALDEILDQMENDPDKDEAQYDALVEEYEELSEPQRVYTDDQKACAGVVLTIGHNGIEVHEGYVRPEDEDQSAGASGEGKSTSAGMSDRPKPPYSGALTQDLRATNAYAVGAAVADHPKAALSYLLFILAQKCLRKTVNYQHYGATVSGSHAHTKPDKNDLTIMPTAKDIAERKAGLPLDFMDLPMEEGWDAFLALGDEDRGAIASAIVGNALYGVAFQHGELSTYLAKTVGADIRDHWRPTAKNFLGRIRKDQLLTMASGFVDEESLKKLTAMKKKNLAQEMERIFDGRTDINVTNWEAVHTWRPEGTVGGGLPANPCGEPDEIDCEVDDGDQHNPVRSSEEIAA